MTYNQDDDLKYAIENNHLNSFIETDIKEIVAEIPGENDEFSWWWVLKLKGDKYTLLSGWCDYTGWDCRSGIEEYPITNTSLQSANNAPEIEEYSDRHIREQLIKQLKGTQPKYTYVQGGF